MSTHLVIIMTRLAFEEFQPNFQTLFKSLLEDTSSSITSYLYLHCCCNFSSQNSSSSQLQYIPVADPGFPRGGGANSPGGVPTYDFAKISQKVHEIERIWTPGGVRPLHPPLDPPLEWSRELGPLRGGARPLRPPLRSATAFSTYSAFTGAIIYRLVALFY